MWRVPPAGVIIVIGQLVGQLDDGAARVGLGGTGQACQLLALAAVPDPRDGRGALTRRANRPAIRIRCVLSNSSPPPRSRRGACQVF
jgi:hypothetical protein